MFIYTIFLIATIPFSKSFPAFPYLGINPIDRVVYNPRINWGISLIQLAYPGFITKFIQHIPVLTCFNWVIRGGQFPPSIQEQICKAHQSCVDFQGLAMDFPWISHHLWPLPRCVGVYASRITRVDRHLIDRRQQDEIRRGEHLAVTNRYQPSAGWWFQALTIVYL